MLPWQHCSVTSHPFDILLTYQPTDQLMDRPGHRKVNLQIIMDDKKIRQFLEGMETSWQIGSKALSIIYIEILP